MAAGVVSDKFNFLWTEVESSSMVYILYLRYP